MIVIDDSEADEGWNWADSFDVEFESFQRDVYILILGTLKAGIDSLSKVADADLAAIKTTLKKASGKNQDCLVEEHTEVLDQNANQERFLRNMAVVALASRLTHKLRTMAKAADHFSPRKKRYGIGSDSEFDRLWKEYTERFSIDFAANADRIAFVEPLQKVRNQIVHDGGEANPFKSGATFEDLGKGDDAYLDTRFSKSYPQFTDGKGTFAEVSVDAARLQSMVASAIALVKWLAQELYAQERAATGQA